MTFRLDFEGANGNGDGGEYEVKKIWDNAIYDRESDGGHLPSLHYLVSWKTYPKEENTWKPALAVQQLCNRIIIF